jgi:hypothetical protein
MGRKLDGMKRWLFGRGAVKRGLFARTPTRRMGHSSQSGQWVRDPLSHPDLAAMTVTQLADLPFEPRRFSRE